MNAPSDAASAHVLDEAERMFLKRGYAGTRLRDLASALGMKPASLYYHAPGGKAELWRRVMTRALDRHRGGLRAAASEAGPDLESQLIAMADWLLSQPPVNVVTLAASNLQAAPEEEAHDTAERMYEGLMVPLAEAFRAAQERGEVRGHPHPDLLAGVFVTAINGLLPVARAGSLPKPKEELGREIVDVLLDGLRPR